MSKAALPLPLNRDAARPSMDWRAGVTDPESVGVIVPVICRLEEEALASAALGIVVESAAPEADAARLMSLDRRLPS